MASLVGFVDYNQVKRPESDPNYSFKPKPVTILLSIRDRIACFTAVNIVEDMLA
ncbi:MAG TPA: hypothetical protein VHX61_18245 [Rhizomicrobium sp.]|nr:hypothetical protein [Rhizomicrobium sp.]